MSAKRIATIRGVFGESSIIGVEWPDGVTYVVVYSDHTHVYDTIPQTRDAGMAYDLAHAWADRGER